MITTKWLFTAKKEGEKTMMNVLITVSAPTLVENRNKVNEFLKEFLKDGWELHFTTLKEVKVDRG